MLNIFKTQKFIEFIKAKNSINNDDIFSVIFQEKKMWIKKGRETGSSKLHRFYYILFPFEILIPVQSKTGQEVIEYETGKIELFKTLGINTPNVLYKDKELFVLEDCGKNVNSYIRKRDICEEKMYYYIDKVIEVLSKIHNSGNFHGGAQARNFTYNNETVYAIDLEDSFSHDIELETLQFRDLVLFLVSLTKTRASFDLDYNYIIEQYISLTKNDSFKLKLIELANKISWLLYLCDINFINNLLGRDVKGFIKLFRTLQHLG